MKTQKNSVIVTGRAGKDLEIKELEGGKKVGRVSIANTEFYKNANKQIVEQTNWINLVFWNETVESALGVIKKGAIITVEGRLKSHSYQDKKKQKRYSTDVVVDKIVPNED